MHKSLEVKEYLVKGKLPLPILYAAWHTKGGSGGEAYIAQ